jgi:hypothetical protein
VYLVFSGEIVVGGEEKHAMALLPAQADHTVEEQVLFLTALSFYMPSQGIGIAAHITFHGCLPYISG